MRAFFFKLKSDALNRAAVIQNPGTVAQKQDTRIRGYEDTGVRGYGGIYNNKVNENAAVVHVTRAPEINQTLALKAHGLWLGVVNRF